MTANSHLHNRTLATRVPRATQEGFRWHRRSSCWADTKATSRKTGRAAGTKFSMHFAVLCMPASQQVRSSRALWKLRMSVISPRNSSAARAFGGFFAASDPQFAGIPASRHEAACASGSIAALCAASEIEAGRYELAAVIGLEQMRNVPGHQAAANIGGTAMWNGHECQNEQYPWPHMFSLLGDEYERRYGLQREHLARIAEINFANARRNPNAQTRGWSFSEASFRASGSQEPGDCRPHSQTGLRPDHGRRGNRLFGLGGQGGTPRAQTRAKAQRTFPPVRAGAIAPHRSRMNPKSWRAATPNTSFRMYVAPSPTRSSVLDSRL